MPRAMPLPGAANKGPDDTSHKALVPSFLETKTPKQQALWSKQAHYFLAGSLSHLPPARVAQTHFHFLAQSSFCF